MRIYENLTDPSGWLMKFQKEWVKCQFETTTNETGYLFQIYSSSAGLSRSLVQT